MSDSDTLHMIQRSAPSTPHQREHFIRRNRPGEVCNRRIEFDNDTDSRSRNEEDLSTEVFN
jgi:hypothetical protein